MIDGFDDGAFFKNLDIDARIWYHNGGIDTEKSYIRFYGDGEGGSRRGRKGQEVDGGPPDGDSPRRLEDGPWGL